MAKYSWTFLIPTISVCASYYVYLQISNYWKSRNVKATVPLPFFGKLLELYRGTVYSCGLIYSSFPDEKYVGVMYTTKPVLLVRDPATAYSILKNVEHFHSRGNLIDKNDFMSKSILFVEEERWDKLHVKLAAIFTDEEIPRFFYLINHAVENFMAQLEADNGERINIHDRLSKLYQNIVLILFVGDFTKILDQKMDVNKRFNSLYSSKFEKNVFFGSAYPCWFSLFRSSLLSRTGEYFRKIVRQVVEFRDHNSYAREDVLQCFLDARGGAKAAAQLDQDFVFDNDAVIAQSLTMLLLGKDTMSNTTSFCLYEIAQQPKIQKNLCNELGKVMKRNQGLTPKAMQELDYLRQVIKETLRKYPSVPVFTRACTKEYIEHNDQLRLQPGDVIAIPVHAIHSDPQYFPSPDKFKPERFSTENMAKIEVGTYLPFGYGAKQCIAQELALKQMSLVLSRILANYEIEPTRDIPKLSTTSFVSSPKNGIWLKLIKKKSPILSP